MPLSAAGKRDTPSLCARVRVCGNLLNERIACFAVLRRVKVFNIFHNDFPFSSRIKHFTDINYCKGCRVCHKRAKCVQSDDTEKLVGEYLNINFFENPLNSLFVTITANIIFAFVCSDNLETDWIALLISPNPYKLAPVIKLLPYSAKPAVQDKVIIANSFAMARWLSFEKNSPA